jgi:hypothetical protein
LSAKTEGLEKEENMQTEHSQGLAAPPCADDLPNIRPLVGGQVLFTSLADLFLHPPT